jgi:hypothetical protein
MYTSLISKLNKFLGTLRQYYAVFRWFVIDSVWQFRRQSSFILVTGFLGILSQVWTIGLAFYYAQIMEKGNVLKFLMWEFDARTSIKFLILCGLAILCSLLFSAWLIYSSRTNNIKLRRKYEEFAIRRIFSSLGSNLRIWTPLNEGLITDRSIFRLIRTDARCCGRILWILMDTIMTVITFLIAVGILLYINSILSIFLFALVGISGVFLYKVNIAGAKNSTLLEKLSGGFQKACRRVIHRLKESVIPLSSEGSWLEKYVISSPEIKKYFDAYEGRLKSIEDSQLISNIFFAIAIFFIVLALGNSIISEGKGWGKLIIYLVALRFMLTNLKQLNKKVTSINRFYPQMKRYFHFVQNTWNPSGSDGKPPANYTIIAGDGHLAGSLERWNISGGSRIGIVSPVEISRYTLAFLVENVFWQSKEAANSVLGSTWFITIRHGYLPGTLRELLDIPPGYKLHDVKKDLEKIGVWNRFKEQLPENFDEPVTTENWRRMEPELKFAISFFIALQSNNQWVAIDERGFRSLPDTIRDMFLEYLSDRITVIVFHNNFAYIGRYREDVIAVAGMGNIIGLGSPGWFLENQQKVKDIYHRYHKGLGKEGSMTADDDSELDDEDI